MGWGMEGEERRAVAAARPPAAIPQSWRRSEPCWPPPAGGAPPRSCPAAPHPPALRAPQPRAAGAWQQLGRPGGAAQPTRATRLAFWASSPRLALTPSATLGEDAQERAEGFRCIPLARKGSAGASSPSPAHLGGSCANPKGLTLEADSSNRGSACSAISSATTVPARYHADRTESRPPALQLKAGEHPEIQPGLMHACACLCV